MFQLYYGVNDIYIANSNTDFKTFNIYIVGLNLKSLYKIIF